jgi:DNA-binding NtrC family response regulator
MPRTKVPPSNVVLLGLAEDLASESGRILEEQGHKVYSFPLLSASSALEALRQVRADLVFCPAEPDRYNLLLDAITQKMAGLPLVVVSRHPDTSAWLDALQAGVSDYCAPPFESIHMRWIMESVLAARYADA